MSQTHDLVVIGAGPAGAAAALEAARAGASALLVDRDPSPGGACVRQGTIPSKTLRETAVALSGISARTGGVLGGAVPESATVASLVTRVEQVVAGHERVIAAELDAAGVERWHGRATFTGPRVVAVRSPLGATRHAEGRAVVVATGSRPRIPDDVPVDHEHVLDSDSVLSLAYLPRSLLVLGSGVIATEYASIFATLGVRVTMLDRAPRPVGFLDAELVERFLAGFRRAGGEYLGETRAASLSWDGVESVVATLPDGTALRADKALFALGRSASVEGLGLDRAGVELTPRAFVRVDEALRTSASGVYAAGDVIGPPALASTSAEQGRRAARHALGLPVPPAWEGLPFAVYSVPELASAGLTEAEARARHGAVRVGRAELATVARGLISGAGDGLLKLVTDPTGERLLGVHVAGEGASELVHLGLVAMRAGLSPAALGELPFNFPTLAEAYPIAVRGLR